MTATTLLLALLPLLTAQEPRNTSGGELRPDQAGWDVLHYDLELKVDPAREWIEGVVQLRARCTEQTLQVALDLDETLEVTSATLIASRAPRCCSAGGSGMYPGVRARGSVRFELRGAGLARLEAGEFLSCDHLGELAGLCPGDEFTAEIRYRGHPRVAPQPPWKGGFTWAETEDGRPWIATSCQGEGADLWWPCKDHPSDKAESMDLRITVPEGLFCASNGVLVGDETADGWRTLHWRVSQPIANYAVALNIAPYEVLEREFTSVDGTSFPVAFYHLPENADEAEEHLPEFLDHLRHLESVCGPYPFRAEKYGIAETPHLGMEHQTIIAYGNEYKGGPDGFDWLHHHELSHEWWGNLVTCRDWKDMWLHEGLATYMQALYAEERNGASGLQRFMRRTRARLGNRRPVAPREPTDSQGIYFGTRGQSDSDIYYKGAWVLHTLRWQLGEETFFELLRRFAYPTDEARAATDGSQVRFVDTEDLRVLAEELSGRDLAWFFELYLRQPELPALEVERRGDRLELAWSAPAGLACLLDVPLAVDGELRRIEVDEHGRASVQVTGEVEVDADGWLLKR